MMTRSLEAKPQTINANYELQELESCLDAVFGMDAN